MRIGVGAAGGRRRPAGAPGGSGLAEALVAADPPAACPLDRVQVGRSAGAGLVLGAGVRGEAAGAGQPGAVGAEHGEEVGDLAVDVVDDLDRAGGLANSTAADPAWVSA